MRRKMTMEEIIALEPCWLMEDREAEIARIERLFGRYKYATIPRVLAAEIGDEDKLWLLLREPFFTVRELRHIACDFAERVLPQYERVCPGDYRLRKAIDLARKYADGEITAEKLWAARKAVCDAAAAHEAAYAALRAVRAAYLSIAESEAAYAAFFAARDARNAAFCAARAAAYNEVVSAEITAQLEIIKRYAEGLR